MLGCLVLAAAYRLGRPRLGPCMRRWQFWASVKSKDLLPSKSKSNCFSQLIVSPARGAGRARFSKPAAAMNCAFPRRVALDKFTAQARQSLVAACTAPVTFLRMNVFRVKVFDNLTL